MSIAVILRQVVDYSTFPRAKRSSDADDLDRQVGNDERLQSAQQFFFLPY